MEMKKKLGLDIRTMRKIQNLDQIQLAQKLGFGKTVGSQKSTISKFENGENLTLDNLEKIADALNCDLVVELVPKHPSVYLEKDNPYNDDI